MMNVDLPTWLATQVKTYAEQERPIYAKYADFIRAMLRQVCNAVAPEASVETRPKAVSSFAEKALRKHQKYDDPVHQLTDLCGARVITDTQEEVERVCQFIRKNFKVDDANSDDKVILLGASQFGYRSVHFVVQLSDTCSEFKEAHAIVGERKAEIQVRTGVQNAWARLAHDRIYKSQFKVPDPIQREMNRASALLEEVDRDFSLVLNSLELYSTSQAAFSTTTEAENEIQTLRMISENVQERHECRQLAVRIASVAKTMSDWEKVVLALERFADDQDPVVLRELGSALCRKNDKNMDSPEFHRGISQLQQALLQSPNDAATHAYLAWSLETRDEPRARNHYAKAYQLKPFNPYYLMAYLEFQIAVERQFGGLSLLAPALEAAVETCRKHASAGIEVPKAQFTEAKLLLLLNQPHAALAACARGVYKAVASESVPASTLGSELQSIRRLTPVKQAIQGHHWLERLLELAISAKRGNSSKERTDLNLTEPLTVVAGGSEPEKIPAQQEDCLRFAFDRSDGTVICGAARAGNSEVIASLRESGAGFQSIGYHPQFLPAGMQLEQRHSRLVESPGTGFSPEDTLQIWADLLVHGIQPDKVRMIGFAGGPLAMLEYQIALALGGHVGVVANSGGAADHLLKDPFWNTAKRLTPLRYDRISIRVFVRPMQKLNVEWLDVVAKIVHEKYREDNKHKVTDPSMLPWDELKDDLKESNRYQVSYSTEILRTAGFGVRKVQDQEITVTAFDPQELELMTEMEHERWMVERFHAGWKLGPRDPANKQSPYLVPWAELTAQVKQWDRDAVKRFPEVLKAAGLEIYRLPR
jgi:ppGpp synthetase/RelA/SpoT-type nucleotidyltranferase